MGKGKVNLVQRTTDEQYRCKNNFSVIAEDIDGTDGGACVTQRGCTAEKNNRITLLLVIHV